MKINNKSQTIASIKKSSRNIYGIMSGIFGLTIIAAICLFVAVIIISYGNSMTDLYTGDFHITYNNNSPARVGNAASFCIGGVIETIVLSAIIASAAKMFLTISRNGLPFTEKTVSYIRRISVLCLINALLPSLSITIADIIFNTADHFTFNIDFGYVAVFLILAAVGKIVSYGAMLQQESDETL